MFKNQEPIQSDYFPTNTFLAAGDNFVLVKQTTFFNQVSVAAHFAPTPNYTNYTYFSITFKAEEIQTDVNDDDNDLVVNILIPILLVSLIILYYLLLLFA